MCVSLSEFQKCPSHFTPYNFTQREKEKKRFDKSSASTKVVVPTKSLRFFARALLFFSKVKVVFVVVVLCVCGGKKSSAIIIKVVFLALVVRFFLVVSFFSLERGEIFFLLFCVSLDWVGPFFIYFCLNPKPRLFLEKKKKKTTKNEIYDETK